MEDMAMSTTTFTVVLIFFLIVYGLYRFIRWLVTARVKIPVGGIEGLLSGGTVLAAAARTTDQMVCHLQESNIPHDRAKQLRNLERDLEQAEQLMELEQKAHALRARYQKDGRKGRQYSPEVEELLRQTREDVERMKRG